MDDIPRVMFNPDGAVRAKIQALIDRGLTVVNAARPLVGDETWEGDFLRGIHYAAGSANEARLTAHWLGYGGCIVELVDNAMLERIAREKYQARFDEWSQRWPDAPKATWEESLERCGGDIARQIKLLYPELPYRSEEG